MRLVGVERVTYRKKHERERYDRFSLPQKCWADPNSHVTIRRPPFKELAGAARKYL